MVIKTLHSEIKNVYPEHIEETKKFWTTHFDVVSPQHPMHFFTPFGRKLFKAPTVLFRGGGVEVAHSLIEATRTVLNGLLTSVKENIWLILALLFFVLVSWVRETINLVTGNAPEPRDTKNTPGTSGLLLVLFMGSGLVYAIIIYPLDWIAGGNLLNAYIPSLLTFSFLAAMTVFEWTELKDKSHISTGLEWIPLSALVYPDGLQYLFLAFPLILLLGRFERPRKALKKASPVVSALWLALGFLVDVFPPEALLWLGLIFGVHVYMQLRPF